MVAAVFDSCILIDYLNDIEAARVELALHNGPAISIVSWIEVLAGAPDAAQAATRSFLSRFTILDITTEIAEAAVAIRRKNRLRLPDAIIMATAMSRDMTLVTRDEKGFGLHFPNVRIPYRL
jgi:predicted nucleic acid-binding protein